MPPKQKPHPRGLPGPQNSAIGRRGSGGSGPDYLAANTVPLPFAPPPPNLPPRPSFFPPEQTKPKRSTDQQPPSHTPINKQNIRETATKQLPMNPLPTNTDRGASTMHGRPALDVDSASRPPPPPKLPKSSKLPSNESLEEDGEMNAHLSEKFRKGPIRRQEEAGENPESQYYPPHELLRMYEREVPEAISPWRLKPEIPTVQDLLSTDVDIPPNRIKGKWKSVEEYLGSHYELLREDAYSTLRDATLSVKMQPDMNDMTEISIYENVRIIGYTWSNFGVGVKCTFSLNRAHKKIRWALSKRLIPGTLVCMSCDKFQDIKNMRLATVLARPISALEKLFPPEIDLLFSDDQIEIDASKSWLMVESRNAYFEAYKHTLKVIQLMKPSNFPLHEHIVSLDAKIPPPEYIKESPILDLSLVFPDAESSTGVNKFDVLGQWPTIKETTMDPNQLNALKRMITRRFAIVQGPPGTGKTYTSVLALKALIHNMKPGDPPIIVSCQTNHALDQLLRKIIEFESNVIRLGGRTQDQNEIKKRTLYQTRLESSIKLKRNDRGRAKAQMARLQKKMMALLEPLKGDLFGPHTLHKYRIINDKQLSAFVKRHSDWVSAKDDTKPMGDMGEWLEGYVDGVEIPHDVYSELEDEEIESDQRLEIETEFHGGNGDTQEFELSGHHECIRKKYVAAEPMGVDERVIQEHLRNDKVWNWDAHVRAAVYKRWEAQLIEKILIEFRQLNVEYAKAVKELNVARKEKDAYILQQAKVVGMTNTGLAKYRSLVAAICPRVVMIEEAAESLEGPIITSCYPSVQHLILVGDHQQLRPHCNSQELEKDPFNLGISMFERLVENGIGYDRLKVQWRMRPEIRRLLLPIYKDLEDHSSVLNKPHVPGMDTTDVFFYWHSHPDSQDEATSRLNPLEAEMAVNFTAYLIYNGVQRKHITILTFYGGQKNLINRLLRKHIELGPYASEIRVATVDSYQGEENEVVLLSLVRSNTSNKIGFLKVQNRVCVAMSRAKRGFYIFGDGRMITHVNELWWEISQILNAAEPKRIGYSLPITCQRHNKRVEIKELSEWNDNKGGCTQTCGQTKPCNHICKLKCHPFGHESVRCYDVCLKPLKCCNEPCLQQCHEECSCNECKQVPVAEMDLLTVNSSSESLPLGGGGKEGSKLKRVPLAAAAGLPETPVRMTTTYLHTYTGSTSAHTQEVSTSITVPGVGRALNDHGLSGIRIEPTLFDFAPPPLAPAAERVDWEWWDQEDK